VLHGHRMADLSNLAAHQDWFQQAGRVSRALGAAGYSAHSGKRSDATLREMLDNTRRAQDIFECPVAVEGQYPAPGDPYLVSSWEEYAQVLASGVPFVVDLSHLNILAKATGEMNLDLVKGMLASDCLMEVHVSLNDGKRDEHRVCDRREWWLDLLDEVHPGAIIFSEGNQRLAREQARRAKEIQ